jgi:hypothetical protein
MYIYINKYLHKCTWIINIDPLTSHYMMMDMIGTEARAYARREPYTLSLARMGEIKEAFVAGNISIYMYIYMYMYICTNI